MKNKLLIVTGLTLFVLSGSTAVAQNVLPNDTLKIGSAVGRPGAVVVVPVYMRSSVEYQGWTLPIKFGNGDRPITCDSISMVGSCMQSIPKKWDFIAPFVNNNDWDNVQTLGVAGVVDFSMQQKLPAGNWLAMKLYFTISDTARSQTIRIDTTRCSWTRGSPPQSFTIVVNFQSYLARVSPGSITITGGSDVADQENKITTRLLTVYPTVVKAGMNVRIRFSSAVPSDRILLFNAVGQRIDVLNCSIDAWGQGDITYNTGRLQKGIYFVSIESGTKTIQKKLIVQ